MHCKFFYIYAMLCFIISSFYVQSAASSESEMSWCDPELCPNGKQHIACNNTGKFYESCEPDAKLVNLRPYRAAILHEHNKRRNFVASGLLPGYFPAARMATMVWDDELEYLATMNLRTCYVEHDDCHNSYRFHNVGQNLSGLDRHRRYQFDVMGVMKQTMGLWFGEYPLIDSSYITKFRVDAHFEEYGHFCEVVIDRNTHVGCAMMRYTHPKYPFLYIYNTACNYGSLYTIDAPIYRAGVPACDCETGPNPEYPALCSINEKLNTDFF